MHLFWAGNPQGRVTDKQDKRSIASIMRKFFDPLVMNDDYKFSESGKYYAPAEGNLEVRGEGTVDGMVVVVVIRVIRSSDQ